MLVTESVTIGGKPFIHNYSDEGKPIKQIETGNIFSDAYDVPTANYTYHETEEPKPEEPTIEEKAAAYDVLMGGNEDDNS